MSSDTVTIRIPRVTKSQIKQLSKEQGRSEGDIVAQQFAKTPPDKIGPLARGSTKEQGVIYISSATGNVYKSPKITITKIRELLQNPYIVSKLEKRTITYFPERVKIEVLDPKQNVDPEVTKILQNMCEAEDVRLSERVIQGDNNSYCYGIGIYNPVWGRKGGRILLQKLRHLPSWSFDVRPSESSTTETWSPLLPGIILGADGKPEYWERKNATSTDTEQITNVMIVKDPKDESLAGDSDLIPLVSIVEMIKFVLNTEMQVINRAGAPIFCIQIVNPRSADDPACDGVSDVDFANMFIKNASKDNSFVLRDNMTIVNIPFDPKKDNLATESTLKAIIDDYFSISNQISKNGTLIGGSAIPEFKLLTQAIKGRHNWLLAPFENLLSQYFVLNGYPEGWTVRLTIPLWEEDKTEQKLKEAALGAEYKMIDGDDFRALLPDLEPADDKKWTKIFDFWKKVQAAGITTPTASQFTKHVHQFDGEGEPLDPLAEELSGKLNDEIDKLADEIYRAAAV